MEQEEAERPVKRLTANQVVAWNIAWYRRAANMTQQELAKRLSWPKNKVSEAERSWDGKRTREFDAQLITEIAIALGVPLLALFLPPDDDPETEYLIPCPPGSINYLDMSDLMRVVMPDRDSDSDVMNAYRDRLRAAVTRYLDSSWAEDVAAWLRELDDEGRRKDRAQRLIARHNEALDMARELLELAEALDPDIYERDDGEEE